MTVFNSSFIGGWGRAVLPVALQSLPGAGGWAQDGGRAGGRCLSVIPPVVLPPSSEARDSWGESAARRPHSRPHAQRARRLQNGRPPPCFVFCAPSCSLDPLAALIILSWMRVQPLNSLRQYFNWLLTITCLLWFETAPTLKGDQCWQNFRYWWEVCKGIGASKPRWKIHQAFCWPSAANSTFSPKDAPWPPDFLCSAQPVFTDRKERFQRVSF